MPKSFREVQDEYNSYLGALPEEERQNTIDLAEFAKRKDEMEGLPERQAAYDPSLLQKVGAGWERLTETTGLPQAFESGFRNVGEVVGAPESVVDVLGNVGRYTPEMALVGWLTGGMGTLPRLANLGMKATGYGLAGLQGVNQTPSPEVGKQLLGAGITAGTFGLGNVLMPAVGNRVFAATQKALQPSSFVRPPVEAPAWMGSWDLIRANNPNFNQALVQRAPQAAMTAKIGSELGVMAGINETARQGMLSVQDVPLDDPARNPLTTENIVGQAAGLLPFTPLFVNSIRRAPKLNLQTHSELFKWLQERQEYVDLATKIESNLDKTTLQDGVDQIGKGQRDLIVNSFLDNLDTLRAYRDQGNTEAYESLLKATINLRKSSQDVQDIFDKVQVTAEKARLSPSVNQGELAKFIDEVNQRIMEIHSMQSEIPTMEKLLETQGYSTIQVDGKTVLRKNSQPVSDMSTVPNDILEAYYNLEQTKKLAKSARDPKVVEQLTAEGYLEPITEESLKRDWNFMFDRSLGDPQFAWRAVIQKQVNKILDAIEPALARRAAERKVQTELNEAQLQENAIEQMYVESLIGLPRFLQEMLGRRGLEIQEALQVSGKSGEFLGKPQSHYPRWREAVIQAAKTFNPETGTFQYRSPQYIWDDKANRWTIQRDAQGNKVFKSQELPIEMLYTRDAKDPKKYAWYPKTVEKYPGRPEGKSLEGTIEGMNTEDLNTFASGTDIINEGGTVTTVSDKLKGPLDKDVVMPVEDMTAPPEGEFTTTYADKADRLKLATQKLSPEAIWNRVQDLFHSLSPTGKRVPDRMNWFRKDTFKLAMEAMMESYATKGTAVGPKAQQFLAEYGKVNKLSGATPRAQLQLALRNFMGGSGKGRDRMAEVIDRLAESKTGDARAQVLDEAGRPVLHGTGQQISHGIVYPAPLAPDKSAQAYANVMRRRIGEVLGNLGMMGEMRETYTEIAMAVAAKLQHLPIDIVTGKGVDAGGIANYDTKRKRGNVLIDVSDKRIDPVYFVKDLINTTLHEISHIDTFVREGNVSATDVYSDQRTQLLNNMQRRLEQLTPEEINAFIVTLSEATEAPGMRSGDRYEPTNPKLRYGSLKKNYNTPIDEAIAVINGLIETNLVHAAIAGTHGKKLDPFEVLVYLPDEIEKYTRGTVRALGDVMEAAQATLAMPEYRRAAAKKMADLGRGEAVEPSTATGPELSHVFRSIVETARAASRFSQADAVRAQTKAFIESMSNTAGVQEPPIAYGLAAFKDTMKKFGGDLSQDRATPALKTAEEKYFRAVPTGNQGGMRKFYPFFSMMKAFQKDGVAIAQDVEYLARSIRGAVNCGISRIYEPFVIRDAAGRPKLDRDNLMIKKLRSQPKGPWRDALNKVRKAQNEKEGKQMFVQETDGTIRVMDDFRGEWDNIRRNLSPEDQQVVQNWSVSLDRGHQIAADVMEMGLMHSNVVTIASVLMSKNERLQYRQAMEMAGKIIGEYYSTKASPTADAMGAEVAESVNSWLGEILPEFEKVVGKLRARPGHSTESLPYDWIIRYKDAQDNMQFLSAPSQRAAQKLAQKLQAEGSTILGEIVDRTKLGEYNDFDAPDTILQRFMEVEKDAWKKYLVKHAEKYGQDAADKLASAYTPGGDTAADLQIRGLGKFLAKQRGLVDRTRYDYLEGFEKWVPRLVSSLQYKSVRQQLNLIMRDPRARGYPDFQRIVRDQFDYIFSPTKEWAHEMTSLLGGYFLGGNLSSAIVEMTQSLVALVPTLIRYNQAGGPMRAYKQLWKSIDDVIDYRKPETFTRVAKAVEGKDLTKLTEDETTAWAYAKAVADGVVDHGVIQDIAYSRDIGALQNSSFGTGRYTEISQGKLATDVAYLGMQHLMRLYSWAALFNNKTSFLAGIRQAYSLGLRGQEAYNHALSIKDLAQFGGGKANMPAFVGQWSNKNTQSIFTVGMTLQRYGFGMFSTYAEMARDAVMKNPNLSPGERLQAKKALGTMMATQTAIAGVFGLPFAAASLTILEKVFGIEANRAVREGLAQLGESAASAWSDDPEEKSEAGARLADLVLNGAGNQMFGIDLSSRAGVSNLFGTSAYRGFNLADLAGPAPSVVENVVKAAGLFGQGEPQMAARELVPQAFKNAIEMQDTYSKYGDINFRDKSGNLLYRPTTGQAAAYMFGFRPAQLSAKRQAQKMLTLSEDNAEANRDSTFDGAAQALIQGDGNVAHKVTRELMAADPTLRPQNIMRMILNRAVDMQYEKDFIASGVTGNDANRLSIARTFGSEIMPQRSEMDYLRLKAQMAQGLGVPGLVDQDDVKQAVMVDTLTRNRQMTRSQAIRMIEFLNRGQAASR